MNESLPVLFNFINLFFITNRITEVYAYYLSYNKTKYTFSPIINKDVYNFR